MLPAIALLQENLRGNAMEFAVRVIVISPVELPPRVEALATASTKEPAAPVVPAVLEDTVIPEGKAPTAAVVATLEFPTQPEKGIVIVEAALVASALVHGMVTESDPRSTVVALVPAVPAAPALALLHE